MKWFKRFILLAIGLIVLFVLAVGVPYVRHLRTIADAVARARERGLPTTFAEFAETYPPPADSDNAAFDYRRVIEWKSQIEEELTEEQAETFDAMREAAFTANENAAPWPASVVEGGRAYLAIYREPLELLHHTTAMPRCLFQLKESPTEYFEMDVYDPDIEMSRPIRDLARLLAFEADWAAQQGEAERSVEALISLFRLARHMGQRHDELAISLATTVSMTAEERLAGFARLPTAEAEHFRRLAASMADEPVEALLHRVYAHDLAEFFEIAAVLISPSSWTSDTFFDMRNFTVLVAGVQSDIEWRIELLDALTKGETANLTRSGIELLDAVHNGETPNLKRLGEVYDPLLAGRHGAPALSSPYVDLMFIAGRVKSAAGRRCARLACALEAYRIDHGALPPTIEALVPAYITELSVDPYTGSPIYYAPAGETYSLQCAGPDGIMQTEDDIQYNSLVPNGPE